MAKDYFSEELGNSGNRDFFLEEIERQKKTSPLKRSITGAAQEFAMFGPFSPKFQNEVAPLIPQFTAFNAATNIATQAQEDPRPEKLIKAAAKSLPFTKAIKHVSEGSDLDELTSLTEPEQITPPRRLITNVVKAVKPDFREPENPYAQFGMDIVGGALTGSPIAAKAALKSAANKVDLLNATKALKNNPQRIQKLKYRESLRNRAKALPAPEERKLLPSPKNLGEDFEILSAEEASVRRATQQRPIYEEMHERAQQIETLQNKPKQAIALLEKSPIEIPFFGPRKKLRTSELRTARDLALEDESVRGRLLSQEGFARLGKSFGEMSEDQLKNEILKLKSGEPQTFGSNPNKERKFIKTVREENKTAPEVASAVKGEYEPISNIETVKKAQALINKDLDEAIRVVKSNATPTAESNTVAQLLIDKFQKEGRFQDAIDIVEKTAEKATSQGQAIQALSLYSRLSPEGVLRYAQRVIDKGKKNTFGGDLKLTPDVAEDIFETAKELQKLPDGRTKTIETAKLLKKIHDEVPASTLEKISMAQTLAQLLNPKTAIRNVLGNTGFAALESVSDVVATGADVLLSKATGVRSKTLPDLKAQATGFMKGAKEAIEETKAGVNISPNSTQFDIPKTGVFRKGVGQKLEKLLSYELRVPDRAFYQAAYEGSLSNQMRAAKVSVATDAMKEVAHMDALYRTFQDPNVVSKVFSGIKEALNAGKDFGLGDAVIKYPKTPGAILSRGIEYSPAGFIKTVIEASKGLRGNAFNQKAFVESFSRALVGTAGLTGSGIILAKLGLITGKKDENKNLRELRRETGLGDYRINISGLKRFVLSGFDPSEAKMQKGDSLITYDWFQPQAINIAIGANIEENKGKPSGIVGTIADGLASGSSTLAEQPLVQGVKRLFGYGDVVQGVGDVLKGIPASFVPTLLNQVRILFDDTSRELESDNPLEESFNLIKNRLPFVSQTLKPRLTPFGEERNYNAGEGFGRAANIFLNPSIPSQFGESENSNIAQELLDYEVTVPPQAKTIRNRPLNKDQQIGITQTSGQIVKEALSRVIGSSAYQLLAPEKKEKVLQKIVRKGKEAAQKEVLFGG